mmetsp:Transcript_14575/g.29147  ORF Transcript_14575/g.29147 Transcript_14575/m.29147 type:complete len:149 (+) Transcript_14575:85-531(+)|eukprot:CAMPEP_0181326596 /NCGR_PEP_ID=MMETSP1101-20121128/21596_1 /TAXON_ID=46948 /ORGANISM="Rhodomonas abbreviata, Strain Caron Lab Isolate" /LENGTH=148 /DNA_ID=CAMNT_0023435087 /DNA_START=80 /DNA_END=526 /DNA_ORIENTATION=-
MTPSVQPSDQGWETSRRQQLEQSLARPRHLFVVVAAAITLMAALVFYEQSRESKPAELLSKGTLANICFGNLCAKASPEFARKLIENEEKAFRTGERLGRKQEALKEDTQIAERHVSTTLRHVVEHRTNSATRVTPWHSQWDKIFGSA